MAQKQIELNKELTTKKHQSTKSRYSNAALSWLLPLVILAIWHVVTTMNLIPSYQLPTPLAVVERIRQFLADGTLQSNIAITTVRVALGVAMGTIAAVVLGLVVGFYSKAEKLFDPLMQSLKSIPGLAWVPLFILWMGIGEVSKVVLIAVGVFFPVYLNIVSGILSADRKLIEVGKIYNFTHLQLVRCIILPATLPNFFTGLRSGVGIGWMFVVASEMMGASQGLGYLLIIGQNSSSPDIIIVSILMFALMGKLSDVFIKLVEQRSLKWRDNSAIGG